METLAGEGLQGWKHGKGAPQELARPPAPSSQSQSTRRQEAPAPGAFTSLPGAGQPRGNQEAARGCGPEQGLRGWPAQVSWVSNLEVTQLLRPQFPLMFNGTVPTGL